VRVKWKFKIGDEVYISRTDTPWYGLRGRIVAVRLPNSGYDYRVRWRDVDSRGGSQGVLEEEIEKVPDEQLAREGLCH
jgi:hypothetical protein